jgi:hypothetical protein
MEKNFSEHFANQWQKYFASAELPIVFYYTQEENVEKNDAANVKHRCLICKLNPVRKGQVLVLEAESDLCQGGKRYLGFSAQLRPNFEYFLSYGIPGKMEGERYKKNPDLVNKQLQQQPPFQAPGKYIVFKRWDKLSENETPLAVIFFASPDILSGLFTLANFDESASAVVTPFGAGCASVIQHPLIQSQSEHPAAVLGMFDVSARPCVPANILTFTVPWVKFVSMVNNMDESFLITESWKKVKSRIESTKN